MPKRIQRRRTRGWRMPANCVCVTRPTKWGNPFKIGEKNPFGTITQDKNHSVSLYVGFAPLNEKLIAAAQAELKGMDLACYCGLCELHADGLPMGEKCPWCDKCHADVLLEIANR